MTATETTPTIPATVNKSIATWMQSRPADEHLDNLVSDHAAASDRLTRERQRATDLRYQLVANDDALFAADESGRPALVKARVTILADLDSTAGQLTRAARWKGTAHLRFLRAVVFATRADALAAIDEMQPHRDAIDAIQKQFIRDQNNDRPFRMTDDERAELNAQRAEFAALVEPIEARRAIAETAHRIANVEAKNTFDRNGSNRLNLETGNESTWSTVVDSYATEAVRWAATNA